MWYKSSRFANCTLWSWQMSHNLFHIPRRNKISFEIALQCIPLRICRRIDQCSGQRWRHCQSVCVLCVPVGKWTDRRPTHRGLKNSFSVSRHPTSFFRDFFRQQNSKGGRKDAPPHTGLPRRYCAKPSFVLCVQIELVKLAKRKKLVTIVIRNSIDFVS